MNNDMQQFLNKLTELKDEAILSGGYVTKERIDQVFPGLNDEQMNVLKEYLETNHIGIDAPIDASLYLSETELNVLGMYLESLEGVEKIDDGKMRVLKMEAIAGNSVSRNSLIEQYLQTVIDTAKLYAGQNVPMIDLIGEGNVALATAVNSCECVEDPDDVDPLIMKMVMNAMEELVGRDTGEADVEAKTLKLAEKVREAAKPMTEELLRKVTVEELSKESGISIKQIKEALRITEELKDLIETEEE